MLHQSGIAHRYGRNTLMEVEAIDRKPGINEEALKGPARCQGLRNAEVSFPGLGCVVRRRERGTATKFRADKQLLTKLTFRILQKYLGLISILTKSAKDDGSGCCSVVADRSSCSGHLVGPRFSDADSWSLVNCDQSESTLHYNTLSL